MKEGSETEHLSQWELCNTWREGSCFTGYPEGCVKEGCRNGHLSP